MSVTELKIKTVINSLYPVFDRSGTIPFNIVFGLCRISSAASPDGDPRSMLLPIRRSVLDVPYAIKEGLLTLWGHDKETNRRWKVDVGQLCVSTSSEESYLTLPSLVGRQGTWKDNLVVYRYDIDPNSEFGRMFEVGKQYTIRNKTGGDLGFKDWKYVDDEEDSTKAENHTTAQVPERKLVAARADGRALFKVVPSVQMPPKLETRIQLCERQSDDETPRVQVTALNLRKESLVAQTRGRQRFLAPWGPMQPDPSIAGPDSRPRLIDSNNPSPFPNLQVVDMTTNNIVRAAVKPGICNLHRPHDQRPKLDDLVTLKPNEPLSRRVELGGMLSKLPDGRYGLRMEPRGMWWCYGSVEGFAAEGEERVPHRLWKSRIRPLMLESNEIVELQVEDGVGKLEAM